MKKTLLIGTAVALSASVVQIGQIEAKAASKTMYVKVSGGIDLNVRASASTTSKKVGTIKNGTKVTVFSNKNGWSKIKFKKGYAYVYDTYLISKKLTTSAVKTTTYYVKTGSNIDLNVRKSKTTSSAKLGEIKNGSKVEVISYAKDWSKVKFGKGYGYVASHYLYKKKLTSSESEKPVLKGSFYATPGLKINLNVRSGESTSSKKLGEISQNTALEVVSQGKNWTKIKFKKGYGFVSNEYVSKEVERDFGRDQYGTYTVFDIEAGKELKTYYQKKEKNIIKWGNVNNGFTHTETTSKDGYTLFNYDTGYGFSINGPIYKGAIKGSLANGYSRIATIDYTAKVKAGSFKNVVVQKFYDKKGKNYKKVYFSPGNGVIKAIQNGQTTFELISKD